MTYIEKNLKKKAIGINKKNNLLVELHLYLVMFYIVNCTSLLCKNNNLLKAYFLNAYNTLHVNLSALK